MKDLQLDRQLFIIWRKACKLQDEIVADIQSCFSYVKIYVITWSPQYLESNFSRFFERPMKMREIQSKYGAGDFLVCIAECESNNHIDILRKYLNKIDCLDAIYVADSPKRINRDVTLLFGKNLEDLRNEGNFYDSEVEMISKDLEGAIGWNSLSHVFYVMNNTLSYCVLRNIDTISDDYDPNLGDIDLLVENLEEAKYVINGRKYLSSYLYPGMHHVNVAGKDIEFDMAFVGDDYMDKRWEKDILRSTRLILPPPPFGGNYGHESCESIFYAPLSCLCA